MAIKHIVFDIDGTLLNTKEAFLGSMRDALDNDGIPHGDLTPYFSLPLKDAFRDFNMTPEFIEKWEADYAYRLSLAPLYEGVREMLTTLSTRVRMALVTSRKHAIAHIGLTEAGLIHLFDRIIAADDVTNPKPAAEPLDTYREGVGCTREEMLYVGDSTVDAECARHAGVKFYAPAWAYVPDALKDDVITTDALVQLTND